MPDRITSALDACNDAQELNRLQALVLFNPTEKIDSVMEQVAGLHDYGVPHAVIDGLLSDLANAYRLNRNERTNEDTIAGHLDAVARTQVTTALGVRGFAVQARPLLKDIDLPGARGQMARRALARLVRENPGPAAAPSLANQLRGLHARLQSFMKEAQA